MAKAKTVLASLNQALFDMMERDPRVILLGEDILDPYGGAFKVTRGLSTRFPDRVFTTPISEAAISGVGVGSALRGLRPIVEIMFGDFLTLAADQLVNHAAKYRSIYNNQVTVPVVIRTPVGGRRGYGPTHSQSLEKHFLGVPGLFVVAPHISGDPGELLKKATLECDDPVLFIESKTCYARRLLECPEQMECHLYQSSESPFPTNYFQHEKKPESPDGILFCYGGMVPHCFKAVQHLAVEEQLFFDLAAFTQLSPPPVDHLREILKRITHDTCILYCEESSVTAGWTAEMIALTEEILADMDNRPLILHRRVGAKNSPVPASTELENDVLPQQEDVIEAVLNCF